MGLLTIKSVPPSFTVMLVCFDDIRPKKSFVTWNIFNTKMNYFYATYSYYNMIQQSKSNSTTTYYQSKCQSLFETHIYITHTPLKQLPSNSRQYTCFEAATKKVFLLSRAIDLDFDLLALRLDFRKIARRVWESICKDMNILR